MRMFLRLGLGWLCVATTMLGQSPAIAQTDPRSATAGSQAMALGVSGANFVAGSVVWWNDSPLPTMFDSKEQIFATVRPELLASPGSARIVVQNPSGLRSGALVFPIVARLAIGTETLPPLVSGANYTTLLSASGGVPPYRWSANGTFPAGFSLSTAGTLSGLPSGNERLSFNVRVTDAAGATESKTIVTNLETPAPRITTMELASGLTGQPYLAKIDATGGTPPYRWSVAQGNLAGIGLALDPTAGTVSGRPAKQATADFVAEVRDTAGHTGARRFSIAITAPAAEALSITTPSLLPNGVAGQAYSQLFTASGGVSPYRWSVKSGTTGGLVLNTVTGVLEGLPNAAGVFSFEVQVTDSAATTAARPFSLVVGTTALTITTGPVLPAGAVGANYNQEFAASGGMPPYTWSVATGAVPGLSLDPTTGMYSGVPTSPGTFSLSLRVRDSAGTVAMKAFSVAVTASSLSLTDAGDIPVARLNEAYSHRVAASGGVPPYTWTAAGLPDGLTIGAATGIIAGAPIASGTFRFTVRVSDGMAATATELYRLQVNAPAPPQLRISGLPGVGAPTDQLPLNVELETAYPAPISGQFLLTFAPDAGGGDSTIRFSTGGRTAPFSIKAGSKEVTLAAPLAIQTGTVAGMITIVASLTSGGVDITPARPPTATLRIERSAPAIRRVRFTQNGNSVAVEITGFSTSRDVTQATFSFTAAPGRTLQTSTITASVEEAFSRWFQDPASTQFGSQFVFTQNFTVSGDAASIGLGSVTLTNRIGSASSSTIGP